MASGNPFPKDARMCAREIGGQERARGEGSVKTREERDVNCYCGRKELIAQGEGACGEGSDGIRSHKLH